MFKYFPITFFLIAIVLFCTMANGQVKGKNDSGADQRAQIRDKYKWNLEHIYPNWTAWEEGVNNLGKMGDEFAELKGTMAEGPEKIGKAYELYDEISILLDRVYKYPYLYQSLDNANNDYNARIQRVQVLFSRLGMATSWFYPELFAIPWDTMSVWLDNNRFLDPYRFNIEDAYRQQKHILDESQEKLLSYFSPALNTPSSIYRQLAYSDIKYNEVILSNGEVVKATPGRYQSILSVNSNQEDRARIFEAHYAPYYTNRNSYAAIYDAVLQRDWAVTQARGYQTALEANLDAYDVPASVVENLINTAKSGYEPLHRYYRIRKEKLGLESYHSYDLNIPIIDYIKEYDFDEATGLVYESAAPLGGEYRETVGEAINNRWIDAFESKGKTAGAFSADLYGVHPYLLLNYNKTLGSVFTLAHEIGHCMHSYLAAVNQPKVTSDAPLFVGEVASQMNEFFLLDYLMKKAKNPEERVTLLIRAIDDIASTFYAQSLNADFELQAHRLAEEGEPITAETLTGIFAGLLKERGGDVIEFDSMSSYAWCRIPHYYETPFYIYQYAVCFAAAEKIYDNLHSPDKKIRQTAMAEYMELLKSGSSDYPLKLLRKAGVDVTAPDTYSCVINKMDELVTQLEKELAKL
jgi:oligoendopeptidase F